MVVLLPCFRYQQMSITVFNVTKLCICCGLAACFGTYMDHHQTISRVDVHPRTGHEAQRGGSGVLYSFFNLGARWDGWLTPRPGRYTPGKDPVPIV